MENEPEVEAEVESEVISEEAFMRILAAKTLAELVNEHEFDRDDLISLVDDALDIAHGWDKDIDDEDDEADN